MTTAKAQFLKNKPLCDQWTAVCKQDWYAQVTVHAMSHLTEGQNLTYEQQQGANMLRAALFYLGDAEENAPQPKGPRMQRIETDKLRNRPVKKD